MADNAQSGAASALGPKSTLGITVTVNDSASAASASAVGDKTSVDVSNINLAIENPNHNDYDVSKIHRQRDEDSMEGAEVGGDSAHTPAQASGAPHGAGGKSVLQVPGGARGSASVAISNINLAVDTPSQNESAVKPRGLRHEEDEEGAADTATMEGCEVGGEPAPSPRLGPVRDVEVSNINLALDTPSQGDYMATQIRQEQVDTENMVGRELGGRTVTPVPSSAPAVQDGDARGAESDHETSGQSTGGDAATPAAPVAPSNAESSQPAPKPQTKKSTGCCCIS